MKLIYIPILALLAISACSSPDHATNAATPDTGTKAMLLDGNWEVDYNGNMGKSMAESFPQGHPTITFDTKSGKLNGQSGCNLFNGTFQVDGNKISVGQDLAGTRKMCMDGMEGEKAFLENLRKINKYSVTDNGRTLNLIMGDLAIIRAQRK